MIYRLLIPIIFLLATAVLILVPFHVCLDLKIDGFSVTGFYRVKWFGFTLHRAELTGAGGFEDRLADEKKKSDKAISTGENCKKKNAACWIPWFDRRRYLKDPRTFTDALSSVFRVLKELLRHIHAERLLLNITVGLDDPANTAVLCGYIWSTASFVPTPATIRVVPYFGGDRLNGSVNTDIWVRVLWVFVTCINSLREKPIRRLLKGMNWKGLGARNEPQMGRPVWGPSGKGNGNRV